MSPASAAAIKSNPARVLFHRQQLLFIAKEALRLACDTAPPLPLGIDLSDLFTMANDQHMWNSYIALSIITH